MSGIDVKEIKAGDTIGKDELVGVIFCLDGIWFQKFAFGKRPDVEGENSRTFCGKGDNLMIYLKDLEVQLNKESPVYQRQRDEWKKEDTGKRARHRTSSNLSSAFKKRMRKMAADPRVLDYLMS